MAHSSDRRSGWGSAECDKTIAKQENGRAGMGTVAEHENSKQIVLMSYHRAYKAVNGKECKVTEAGGWYRVNNGLSRFRLGELAIMTLVLQARATTRRG